MFRLLGLSLLATYSHFIIVSATVAYGEDLLRWTRLPDIPNEIGLAGPIVGKIRNQLVVAGGANFPTEPPWTGGKKVWHDQIYVLDDSDTWRIAGKLPHRLAYAVCISIPTGLPVGEGILVCGGSDELQHFHDCFLLYRTEMQWSFKTLPALPQACANACGILLGDTVYLCGGSESPNASVALHTCWSMNLRQQPLHWKTEPAWPGPARMLATIGIVDQSLILASGAELISSSDGTITRNYLRDAYLFSAEIGWKPIADLPRPTVAAPYPATNDKTGDLIILGGDDGTLVNFQPPQHHPGFPKSALSYSLQSNRWQESANQLPSSMVTTFVIPTDSGFIIPTGEICPGVRSPQVWKYQLP